jgi:type II secretory pathway predicted ATPase ExeA
MVGEGCDVTTIGVRGVEPAVWTRHWGLSRDPFLDAGSPYVPTAPHEEAVARLSHTIEAGQRLAVLRAAAGLGKTTVLARALAAARLPSRRVARVDSPADGEGLLAGLAEGLGARVPPSCGRATAWKRLADAVRLCRWQRLGVVLAIDDGQHLVAPVDRLDLDRLVHLDPHPDALLTVVRVHRTDDDGEADLPAWELAIRLDPLTRSEAGRYVAAKLAAAGRPEPTFTPRALHRLHARSGGVPRGLDRLGSLALMAGALRGLEMITPEVVEGVARECAPGPAAA